MRLDFDSGLPEPSKDTLRQLQEICRDLFVIRSRWILNWQTLQPYEHPVTKQRVERPRYWVCVKTHGKYSVLFPIESPTREYMPFDVRTIQRIKTDIGRLSLEEQDRILEAAEDRRDEANEKAEAERKLRFYENNKPAFRDALANAQSGVISKPTRTRDGKLFSYPGQESHGGSGQVILTPKERGIDVPE